MTRPGVPLPGLPAWRAGGGLPALAMVAGAALAVTAGLGNLAGLANAPASYGFNAVAALTFLLMGALIVQRRPGNAVGWVFVATGLVNAVVLVSASFGQWRPLGWVQQWTLPLPFATIALLLLLFPDGHLVSRRGRAAVWLVAGGTAVAAVALAAAAWQSPILLDYDAATSTAAGGALAVAAGGLLALGAGALTALASLVVRWRGASGVARDQLKMLGIGGAATAIGLALDFALGIPWLWALLGALIPLSAGAAMLHYRLYDADLVLNRSLVYAVLTVVLLGAYLVTVTALGTVFSDRSARLSPLVATGIVAVAFQPLRSRVQQAINHLLYGARDDPSAVLVSLSRGLESAADPAGALPRVVQTVAEALRLPYAAIETTCGDEVETAAAWGRSGMRSEAFPMLYQGQQVGRLLAAPRTLSEPLTADERRLLQDVATQAAMVVHASRLTIDLRRSRERLVRSREEERRRLRRDLHDGLGPTLAGMTMQVGAAKALLTDAAGDPDAAVGLLEDLERQLQASVGEIRRLVDDLRPPTLDQLGLLAAVRPRAEAFAPMVPGTRITVTGPDDLSELPAAVEVAAYRIAVEAITNVVRHADARTCRVEISTADNLVIEVSDDGVGLHGATGNGVGLSSMRERAEELGGTFTVTDGAGGGTRIRTELPAGTP